MLKFYKYHGAGNDFIILDNVNNVIPEITVEIIKKLCHRRFGIGADGLMILKQHEEYDFAMDYYNADGSGATLCGNGGRCITAFAYKTGIIKEDTAFMASDGMHMAKILKPGEVSLKMNDVGSIENIGNAYICYTGSPHYIEFSDDINGIDVYTKGRNIRYSDKYNEEGINVNFVKKESSDTISVRTYERGVEDETLACGTGSVAAALTFADNYDLQSGEFTVNVKGGTLKVSFKKAKDKFTDIWLTGPAEYVFEGNINI